MKLPEALGESAVIVVEQRHRVVRRQAMAFALLGLLPLLMGGCPQFRNSSVDALGTATKSVLLGGGDTNEALDVASLSVLDSAIDLLFDQFRTDDARR